MKFDRRFFNFEDPEVFENMTGENLNTHWKETYGFDFAAANNENYDKKYDHIRNIINA